MRANSYTTRIWKPKAAGPLSISIAHPTNAEIRKDYFREKYRNSPTHLPRHYQRQADAVYDLQMREAIMYWLGRDVSHAEIARRLGQHPQTIHAYKRVSINEAVRRVQKARWNGVSVEAVIAAETTRPHRPALKTPMNPHRVTVQQMPPEGPWARYQPQRALPEGFPSSRRPGSKAHLPPEDVYTGDVLDPPDIVQLRRDCLRLRKSMISFEQMAELLGISEEQARLHTAEALRRLRASDAEHAENERTLMIAQLDQMIEAIHPLSTGIDLQHGRRPVVLEAIDRMLKLMNKKSELLGLSAPPAVDIRIRLQALAAEGGYDILDLEEIAREVLQRQKIKLPEFR